MSSPINATEGATGAKPVGRTSAADGVCPTHAAHEVPGSVGVAPGVSPVSLSAIPASPPPEVLDQLVHAAQRYESFSAQGRELRFSPDDSGAMTLEVRDSSGAVLQRLSLAEALDLAAGTAPQ